MIKLIIQNFIGFFLILSVVFVLLNLFKGNNLRDSLEAALLTSSLIAVSMALFMGYLQYRKESKSN